MIQKLAGLARVLAGDDGRLAQNSHGAKGHIVEVADRRGDNVKGSGHTDSMASNLSAGRARSTMNL